MLSQSEYQASVAVWQYCPPVLLTFGTFGNIMTIIILRRMNLKRSAMPIYLTALAVSDMFVLYTGLLRWWIMHTLDVDIRVLHTVVCKVHTWLVYATVIMSAWLLTFMTVERALSVWLPHRVNLVCTRRKACVIVCGIVFTSLAVNSHFLYGLQVVVGVNGTSPSCEGRNEEYMYFFDAMWSWVDFTLASLIPFTVLIIGNGLILWKVTLSVREARTLTAGCPEEVLQRKKTVSSMTVTLVALSVIFLLTTSPVCVYNVVEHFIDEGLKDDPRGSAKLTLAWAITNILMYTNNTVNFYLYCLSGVNFRRELRQCLCCLMNPPLPGSEHGSRLHNLQHTDLKYPPHTPSHTFNQQNPQTATEPRHSPSTRDTHIHSKYNDKSGETKTRIHNHIVKNVRKQCTDAGNSTEF